MLEIPAANLVAILFAPGWKKPVSCRTAKRAIFISFGIRNDGGALPPLIAIWRAARGLKDKRKDRGLYRDYLAWLSADDAEQKLLGFERMGCGWAKGGKEFKKAVLKDHADEVNK